MEFGCFCYRREGERERERYSGADVFQIEAVYPVCKLYAVIWGSIISVKHFEEKRNLTTNGFF